MDGAKSVDAYFENHPQWAAALAKILPMIAAGGGLHDKYRAC